MTGEPSTSPAALLRHQLRYAWTSARWQLDELSDDEYWWEPTSPCWSVRPRAEGRRGWGAGELVCEDAWPSPDPLPVTTIAWRVIHLAAWTDVYREWTFGAERPTVNDAVIPTTAADGVAWLLRVQDDFLRALDELPDDDVFAPRPAHWGETLPVTELVTNMLVEHVHHLAEIGALRDLRAGHARIRPRPES